ncbi:MAG TPA: gamma-glutamyl-gamma-aminobutyrate hydrolase family protein [Terracidiphilus sp.]|jgi:putative glutamine amidotransferase
MNVRIAIPEPTGSDAAYNSRALPQYIAAVQSAGATVTVIPLVERPDRIARLLASVHGVLLPGSRYDIDPQVYGEARTPACNEPDPARAAVDELLMQDAFNLRKPLLGICGGMQAINVWRGGSLIQDLPAEGLKAVNHAPGREVEHAHEVRIEHSSRLAGIAPPVSAALHVNSSHHQAVKVPGDNLRITASCPDDGVIEAIELHSPDQFVVGVQWHPERTYSSSAFSRAIFQAFVREGQGWVKLHGHETVPVR